MKLKKNRWIAVARVVAKAPGQPAPAQTFSAHAKARVGKHARQWAAGVREAYAEEGLDVPEISLQVVRAPRKPVDVAALRQHYASGLQEVSS